MVEIQVLQLHHLKSNWLPIKQLKKSLVKVTIIMAKLPSLG